MLELLCRDRVENCKVHSVSAHVHSESARLQVAQSYTDKPVKGMLTGPVTIINWSFPRQDVSRSTTSYQLAFALREEVADLEKAGCRVIQVATPTSLYSSC